MYYEIMEPYLEFNPIEHAYYYNGVRHLSVTEVLRAAGLSQQYGLSPAAADRGRIIHELTAIDDREGLDMRTVPKSQRPYIRAWRDFRALSSFVPTRVEFRVDHVREGYSGTVDRVGTMPGHGQVVLDIKTLGSDSGGVADEVKYQLSAYAMALNSERAAADRVVYGRLAVALRPNGTFSVKLWPVTAFFDNEARWVTILNNVKNKSVEDTNIA